MTQDELKTMIETDLLAVLKRDHPHYAISREDIQDALVEVLMKYHAFDISVTVGKNNLCTIDIVTNFELDPVAVWCID